MPTHETSCVNLETGSIPPGTAIEAAEAAISNPLLDDVWATIADAGVPVIIHCGSGPTPGIHTGPTQIRVVLDRHPNLKLIIAHLGMPEYREFLDLCEQFTGLYLDTTMAFTPFVEETMPFPPDQLPRLAGLGDRILFGSDFPNIPYRYAESLEVLSKVAPDDDWMRKVLYHNAAKLFDLGDQVTEPHNAG